MRRTFKMALSALAVVVVVVVALVGFALSRGGKPQPPKRPASVPVHAVWVGGLDGGVWVDVKGTVNDRTIECGIYNDQTGDLEYEGKLVGPPNKKPDLAKADAWDGRKLMFEGGYSYEVQGDLLKPKQ